MRYKGLPYTLIIIQRKLRAFGGNFYLLLARFNGIKIPRNCTFIGRPKFKIYPKSNVHIGDNCEFLSGSTDNLIGINRPCIISTFSSNVEIKIGNGSGFSGTVIGAFKSISIGNNVKCGANTLITDSDWHPEDPRSGTPRPIVIEDNVWLGVNSVVLKGVNIGKNTVIGANSVVTKNIPPNVVAAGNPCKVLKALPENLNL